MNEQEAIETVVRTLIEVGGQAHTKEKRLLAIAAIGARLRKGESATSETQQALLLMVCDDLAAGIEILREALARPHLSVVGQDEC